MVNETVRERVCEWVGCTGRQDLSRHWIQSRRRWQVERWTNAERPCCRWHAGYSWQDRVLVCLSFGSNELAFDEIWHLWAPSDMSCSRKYLSFFIENFLGEKLSAECIQSNWIFRCLSTENIQFVEHVSSSASIIALRMQHCTKMVESLRKKKY